MVTKFEELERLIKVDPLMTNLVEYYRQFNKEMISKPEESLPMLYHVGRHGDENVALYEYRKTHTSSGSMNLPEELK